MTNRLIESQSLYLKKHAENPIDWWPWTNEALSCAKSQNKPIFLSIGYSSCHWCTVMEGEAFSDPDIAAYMNQHFLPIKVDREERPDIDSIYMQILQMMNRQGGWPLNMFLDPYDLIPFYGGTYFPLQPRYNLPGFLELLEKIRYYYDTEKTKLQSIKQEISSILQQSTLITSNPALHLNPQLLHSGIIKNSAVIANQLPGPAFPMIPYANLTLAGTRFKLDMNHDPAQASQNRGVQLSLGGIFDHVGGGFHRYTVDPTWTVPHFEKMLYDNGQIIEYLANLWSSGQPEPSYSRAIIKTSQWLKREMISPAGYFYAASDADSFTTPDQSEPEEGAFYVFSYSELQNTLTPEQLTELETQFTITPEGNFESKNVLQRKQTQELNPSIEASLTQLFKIRYGPSTPESLPFPPATNNTSAKSQFWPGRIPPVTDTKMIVAWNSLMISGLVRAYITLSCPGLMDLATTAANFIYDHQIVNGIFYRLNYQGTPTISAQAEDYAFFIKALLDLQQGDLLAEHPFWDYNPKSNINWLERAIALQDQFDEQLWSIELGGYYNTSLESGKELLIRERSYIDNATPSPNGIAIANLVRLALLTQKLEYLDRAEQALNSFAPILDQSPTASPSIFTALDWYLNGTLVSTNIDNLSELMTKYHPTTVYQKETNLPSGAIGQVCRGLTCLPPAMTKQEIIAQIK